MGSRERRARRGSLARAFGLGLPGEGASDGCALHIAPAGWVQVENCRGIERFDGTSLVLKIGERRVCIEGDELCVEVYRETMTAVRGRIFRVTFLRNGREEG